MRLFVSVDFPAEITEYFCSIQKKVQAEKLFEGRFVASELLHITLQFIGEISEDEVKHIQNKLEDIVFKQFTLCLGSLGIFEKNGQPFVLWVGVHGDFLHDLVEQIKMNLSTLVTLEDREFVSHITLARIKKVYTMEKLQRFIENFNIEPYCFPVQEFTLKESFLGAHGREHRIIARYRLQKQNF